MRDNNDELLPKINENGTVIGSITRGEAHNGKKFLHPVVHLHVFNSNGDIYLQHRPEWKTIQPNKWDTACGGHVAYREDIETALIREVKEEIGITDFTPIFVDKYIFESNIDREYVYVFKTIYDKKICPNEKELNGGKFFSQQEIKNNIGKEIFTPNFELEYKKYF